MELMKPKAILFDWDNTLADTWPIIHQALHDTFVQWEMEPWSLETVKERVAKSMREAFPSLFGKDWEVAGKAYQDHYRKYQLDWLKPLPAAEALLQALQPADVFVGIVSNKRGENLRKELKHLGWERYFSSVVGSEDAPRDKPYADPVQLALKDSSFVMDRTVWFVGDSIIDLQCAEDNGMTGILYGDVEVHSGEGTGGRYRDFSYDVHVRDHHALVSLLQDYAIIR
ncbi:MAG: HAD family hydrolase [Rickettsiales bacterium]|nr:HAD family hydrolase [Rickettsiales bacterium]